MNNVLVEFATTVKTFFIQLVDRFFPKRTALDRLTELLEPQSRLRRLLSYQFAYVYLAKRFYTAPDEMIANFLRGPYVSLHDLYLRSCASQYAFPNEADLGALQYHHEEYRGIQIICLDLPSSRLVLPREKTEEMVLTPLRICFTSVGSYYVQGESLYPGEYTIRSVDATSHGTVDRSASSDLNYFVYFVRSTLDRLQPPEQRNKERQLFGALLIDWTRSHGLKEDLRKEPSKSLKDQIELKDNWQVLWEAIQSKQIEFLFHFTDESNVESILKQKALFSWQACSIRGVKIPRPGGNELSRQLDSKKGLGNYVRLAFNERHPMLYVAKADRRIVNPIIIKVSTEVMLWKSTLFSNANATDNTAEIGVGLDAFSKINCTVAVKGLWRNLEEKRMVQSEVLIQEKIPIDFFEIVQK